MGEVEPGGELTRLVINAAFRVSNALGSGYLGKVYERALHVELEEIGLEAVSQTPITVRYRGRVVGDFVADIVVEQKLVPELKACRAISAEHIAQTINDLTATSTPLGLILHFGTKKLGVQRLARTPTT